MLLTGCAKSTSTDWKTSPLMLVPNETRAVEITADQTLIVEIPSNPTTGFKWELNQRTRERRCYFAKELDSKDAVHRDTEPVRAGMPSIQKWVINFDPAFSCQTEQRIQWIYRRSWEPLNTQETSTQIILKKIN